VAFYKINLVIILIFQVSTENAIYQVLKFIV